MSALACLRRCPRLRLYSRSVRPAMDLAVGEQNFWPMPLLATGNFLRVFASTLSRPPRFKEGGRGLDGTWRIPFPN